MIIFEEKSQSGLSRISLSFQRQKNVTLHGKLPCGGRFGEDARSKVSCEFKWPSVHYPKARNYIDHRIQNRLACSLCSSMLFLWSISLPPFTNPLNWHAQILRGYFTTLTIDIVL
jgi:hypothetical protein